MRGGFFGLCVQAALSTAVCAQPVASPSLGVGADLNGAIPFSADSAWNTRVDAAPLRPQSRQMIEALAPDASVVPEFGSGTYHGAKIGIPYVVVPEDQPKTPIYFTPYGEFSDLGAPPYHYPIPADAPIEGEGASAGSYSDRHVIIVQRAAASPNGLGRLYELFKASRPGAGQPTWTGFGAIFDMSLGDRQRPTGWTSADAAGLPIFPGLVRYDEVSRAVREAGPAGVVQHAFRFTLEPKFTAHLLVSPAQHVAGPGTGPAPFGLRVRLKADWTPRGRLSPEASVIVNTLKRYGMIMADNGGNWFVTGAPDERWVNDDLRQLRTIKGRDFEIVDSGPIQPAKP